MSKAGVFNPYQEPPEKKKEGPPPDASIRLDGDSYILEFQNVRLNEIPSRLGNLIHDVREKHLSHMVRNGIELYPLKEIFNLEKDELVLPTPKGHLVVYVGEGGKEVDAYRRVAFALRGLPIADIMNKYQARIIARS